MEIDSELKLSFYREIAVLNEEHGVELVQHLETKKIFVKKRMKIYDIHVFQYLMSCSIPGIPRIEELVEADDRLFVIEEYISGDSLREKLDADGPLTVPEAVSCIRQLCDILRPLHRLSPPIVHRDIKPSNIIITSAGQLYLVDFNSAKETSDSKNQDTVLIGTFGYAAPEQYGFSASQPTADIYALGVLLNEMLTGKKPQEKLPDGPLAAIVKKCMQMDPSNRYQDVDQLLRDLGVRSMSSQEKKARVRSWLPPGFRSGRPVRQVVAVLWYAFILLLSSSAVIQDAGPAETRLFRAFYFIVFLTETFWFGNYQNVWQHFPLSRHSNRGIRVLGTALWALVFFFVAVLILGILTRNF